MKEKSCQRLSFAHIVLIQIHWSLKGRAVERAIAKNTLSDKYDGQYPLRHRAKPPSADQIF